jgi:hypothetical protein
LYYRRGKNLTFTCRVTLALRAKKGKNIDYTTIMGLPLAISRKSKSAFIRPTTTIGSITAC